jgi:DMSO/TMAO reductase YedYZ heme-binding membrane subunit
MDLNVFLPRFDSWVIFLQLGGRLAWYLIVTASLAAALRKVVGRNWRVIHLLNYVAFLLGTIHAVMIGTDFQSGITRAASIVLGFIVIATFIQKRLAKLK